MIDLKTIEITTVLLTLIGVLSESLAAADAVQEVGDKTLVVWAAPADLSQRGGSALTLDAGHFDGIVFGELASARWMAGSEVFQRSLRDQEAVKPETASADTFVQIAIVYAGREVTLYRNGEVYSQYLIDRPVKFSKDSAVLMGLRHLQSGDKACFAGEIDDARIYASALTAEQLKGLRPNQVSEPAPWAWWNFEDGKPVDVQETFPPAKLTGAAHIENGRLILDGNLSYLVTPPDATANSVRVAPDVTAEWILKYHLMHPGQESMPGDPNAAFCLDGVYHLHYILSHPWRGGNSFSFMHVTSPDMLHWTWQPTTLQPAFTGHGMFSGTGFLMKDDRPAVIYHGQGSGRNQIAIAKDRQLTAWEKPYPVEVQTSDGKPAEIEYWDPDCFRIGNIYYAISGGQNPPLMKSTDLKNWTLVGDFVAHQLPDVTIGEDISCPNFFPIGDKWMLLCISHPLGCRYYIGDWDAEAEQFVPETHGRMNWKRDEQRVYGLFHRTDFFAPESVLTPDGRRVMWAWLTTVGPRGELLRKTIQSLPRELSLSADGQLRVRPIRELETLRDNHRSMTEVKLDQPVSGFADAVPPQATPQLHRILDLAKDSAEILIRIPRSEAERKLFGFVVYSDGKGAGLPILFRPETGTIRVGTTEAPFAISDLEANEDVELRIFLDRYLVEVFVNDRQALVGAYFGEREATHLDGFTLGTPTILKSVDVWTMKVSNQGFLEAQNVRVWEPKGE